MSASVLLLALATSIASAESPYAPAVPPPRVQAFNDTTPLPAGQGGLFIPALTQGDHVALVVSGSQTIEIPVGQRVALAPGQYVVLVGSGDPSLATAVPVQVVAGTTALVPVTWGALHVQTVDRRGAVHDGTVQLVHVETGAVIPASATSTWLLSPGLYALQAEGQVTTDPRHSVTVHIPESGVVTVQAVVDPRSGTVQGGRVVPTGDTAPVPSEPVADGIWTGSAVVGIQGTAGQTQNVPGMPDQLLGAGSVFLDASGGVRSDHHRFTVGAQVEEGQQLVQLGGDRLPLLKAQDKALATADYTFQFNEGTGVYVRGSAQTQLLDTYGVAPTDGTVAIRERDGSVTERSVQAGDRYSLAKAFQPLQLQTGAGLAVSFVNFKNVELTVRGGPSWRRYDFSGVLVPEDNPDTDAWEFTRAGSFDALGVEAGAVARVRVAGWLSVSSELDVFFPASSWSEPMATWDNRASVSLTEFLSVDYVASLGRLPAVTPETSIRQGVYLRASWSLL